jgi:DNA polymerase I-like protein with 3'-5' exonuclease and polymerase domains
MGIKLLSSAAVRRNIAAPKGWSILSADFDQIELRIAAAMAGEAALIAAAERGESLHKIAAVKLFGPNYSGDEYRYTKNVNFGWLYGGGAYTLSQQAGIPLAAAVEIKAQYEKEFPKLTAYKRREQQGVLYDALSPHEFRYVRQLQGQMFQLRLDTKEGRRAAKVLRRQIEGMLRGKTAVVTTDYGRRLIVDAAKAYSVVNYKIQSTARDIMCDALMDVMDDDELEPTVLLPIHDELLGMARAKQAERIARRYGEVMTRRYRGVLISASGKVYGKSWGHGYIK